jgi:hypothetical protein
MTKLKNEDFINSILSFIKENQKNNKGFNNIKKPPKKNLKIKIFIKIIIKINIKIQKEIHFIQLIRIKKKYQLKCRKKL